MWSKRAYKEFGSFAALMLGGVIFGNILLSILALIPLLFVLFSLMYSTPGKVKVIREVSDIEVSLDDVTVLNSRLKVDEGVGLVMVMEKIPSPFVLTSGNNFRIFWKGLRPLDVEMSFTVKCIKRGVHHTGQFNTEGIHFSGLKDIQRGNDDDTVDITVRPRSINQGRMRDNRLYSRIPMPPSAVSRLGSRTTEFLEIRQYSPGDLYRNINWKATMRSGRDESAPLVNEFEREGRKTVWIFLDGRPHMGVGTNVVNAFEHGVQAASALSRFYLTQGCSVGLNILGSRKAVLPDTGRRQERVIIQSLTGAEISKHNEPMDLALRRCHGHIAGRSPLVAFITTVRKENVRETRIGIRKMRSLFGHGTKVMVLHISGDQVAAETSIETVAADLLSLRIMPEILSLGVSGTAVYFWNPQRQNIASLMLRGAIA